MFLFEKFKNKNISHTIMPLIQEIQSENVVIITKDKTINDALDKMAKRRVSCLVVMIQDKVEGIITHKDIIDKVVTKRLSPENLKVDDIMSSPVQTVNPDQEILFAATTMNSSFIKQLPVIDDEGNLVGIVTQTDIIRNILNLAF